MPCTTQAVVNMGKREANKLERRQRIIQAARQMIQEESFSMRALATMANVTVVTVYSLFGSRQNVIAAVLEEDLELFNANLLATKGDALDRIFNAVELTAEVFINDSSYHSAMIRTIYQIDDAYFYSQFFEPRLNFWENLIKDTISCNLLNQRINYATISKSIIYLFIGFSQEWVRGAISINQMRAEIGYGVSLLLLPFAGKKATSRLLAKLYEFNDNVQKNACGNT